MPQGGLIRGFHLLERDQLWQITSVIHDYNRELVAAVVLPSKDPELVETFTVAVVNSKEELTELLIDFYHHPLVQEAPAVTRSVSPEMMEVVVDDELDDDVSSLKLSVGRRLTRRARV